MAKKRMRTGGRGISTPTANGLSVARPTVFLQSPVFDPIGDRRRFTMDRTVAPVHAVNRNATRIVVDKFGKSVRSQTRAPLKFAVPDQVAICNRRKARKEVLHALAKTGHGTLRKKPRRNYWSNISCR